MLWYVVRLHQVSYVTTDFIGGLSIFWSNHTKTNSLNREGYFVLYILMALWALSLLTSTIWRKQPSIGLFWWRKSIPSNFRRCVWFEIELIWWFKSRTLDLFQENCFLNVLKSLISSHLSGRARPNAAKQPYKVISIQMFFRMWILWTLLTKTVLNSQVYLRFCLICQFNWTNDLIY